MTKRTRKWAYVAQEARRLASLGMSAADIARALDVEKSTIGRWIKAGKLDVRSVKALGGSRGKAGMPPPSKRQAPQEWAAAVRKDYALDSTDDQLVTIGEVALGLSLNPVVAPNVRMNAAGRFQAIVRQLSLGAQRGASQEKPVADAPAPEMPRQRNPAVARPAGDPRGLLMAVSK